MKKANQHTAILIFAHSSDKEAVEKPFYNCEALFNTLNLEVEAKAQKTGLPYFIIDENSQIGNSFGERFANAIQSVYNKGFQNVITIGNDVPLLKVAHLIEASQNVSKHKTIIGKTNNGGFYLLALNKNQFKASQFKHLAWQTSKISQDVKHLVSKTSTLECLEILKDINYKSDLNYFTNFKSVIDKTLFSLIVFILKEIHFFITNIFQSTKTHHQSLRFNKGSPILLA